MDAIQKRKPLYSSFFASIVKWIAVIVIAIGSGYSEDTIPDLKNISLATGYSYVRILDNQVSPLIYRARMLPLSIGYYSRKDHRILDLNLNLVAGLIGSDRYRTREVVLSETDNDGVIHDNKMSVGNLPVFQDEIDFRYMQKINTKRESVFNLYAGGMLKQYLSFSMGLFPLVHSELSLNLSTAVEYNLSYSTKLSSSLSFPVISAITRLPYSNDPFDGKHDPFISTYVVGTRAATVNKYQRINFNVAYEKQFEKWSTGAVYSFYWMNYSENRGLRAYDNCIELKVARIICKRKRSNQGKE